MTTEENTTHCNSSIHAERRRARQPSSLPFSIPCPAWMHPGANCHCSRGQTPSAGAGAGLGVRSPPRPPAAAAGWEAVRWRGSPFPRRRGEGREGAFGLGKLMRRELSSLSPQRASPRIFTVSRALSRQVEVVCLQILPLGSGPF